MAIPKGTEIPKSSGQFAKFQDGKNRFRFLSDFVVGWEGWKDKKPFRHEGQVCRITSDQVDLNQNGRPNINYFWAAAVWNYNEKRVQVLEITQKTIMEVLKNLEESTDWGDLKTYDVEITRTKTGDKTNYTTVGIPHKVLPTEVVKEYEESKIDLRKLFSGEYPMETPSKEVNPDEIPF